MARDHAPDLRHLPGDDGAPLVGHTLQFLRDPYHFAFAMHARHGPLFRSRIFFERGVSVASPDFAERFFVDKDELFSSRRGWWTLLGDFFPGGLMLRDFAEHRVHRRVMQVAFRHQALGGYVDLIDPLIARAVDDLGRRNPPVAMYPFIKRLLLDTAAAVFVGIDLGAESDRLNRDFVTVMHAAATPVRRAIPLTPYWRGLRARRRLVTRFHEILRRRDTSQPRQDMLSILADAVSEEGERFGADEIVEHILFLLMAAHDTTTSGLTCLLMCLARSPEWQERARAEAMALSSDHLAHDDLAGLTVIWDCFREALRLYPPVRSIPRRTTRACEIEGHAIPANTPMWVNTEVNHRDPSIWTRPDDFEPDRFAEPRAEHRRHKFAWLPFGGGAHTCLGLQFSRIEVSLFLHRLLRRYRLRVPDGWTPRMKYLPFVRPADDLPLILEPLP